ncbi:MAG: tetratricopeptide repeat protein [Candidatus Heimdallarchaeota archaeon]|nr:tetratricopeptide repeat protein [Candidatus Heimdallarchaeota archaeon]
MVFGMIGAMFKNAKLNKLHKQAVEFAEKKEFEKAISNFLKILEDVPDHGNTWMNLGIAYYQAKKYQQAADSFKSAYINDKSLIGARFNLATTLIALNKFTEAIPILEESLKVKPDDHRARIELAKLYWHQGEHQKALDTFHQVLLKDYNNVDAIRGAAEAYLRTNQSDKAIEYYERLLTKAPDDAVAYYQLGYLYGNKQKYDLARERLGKALKIKPDFLDSLFLLAKIDILTEKFPEAIKNLEQLNKSYPNKWEILLHLGLALGNSGNLDRAITIFDQVIKLEPNSIDAWKFLTICHNKLGNKEKAAECEAKYRSLV